MQIQILLPLFICFVPTATFPVLTQEKPDQPDQPVEAEEVVDVEADLAQMVADNLKTGVGRELQRLRKMAALSDDEIKKIEAAIAPAVERETKRRVPSSFVLDEAAPPSLIKAIAKAAQDLIKEPKRIAPYLTDVKDRMTFFRETCVVGFLSFLDTNAGLTLNQRSAAAEVGGRLFDSGDIAPLSFEMGLSNPKVIVGALKNVLAKEQLEDLQILREGEEAFGATIIVLGGPGGEKKASYEERKAEVAEKLRRIAGLRIRQLDADLELSAKQKRRLELFSKSIVGKLSTRRVDAVDLMDSINFEVQTELDSAMEAAIRDSSVSLPELFVEERYEWDKRVSAALTDSQKVKWNQICKQRRRRAH